MIRVVVLYDEAPDPQRYEAHVELCKAVPGAAFRHGPIFGAPVGAPPHQYYAEFEWPDLDSFETGASSPEFAATGKDALAMGVKFNAEFARLEPV
jgi:hypothetical protein